jgi:hypothetical protein
VDSTFPLNRDIGIFLLSYSEEVTTRAILLREIILQSLPGIQEILDEPAKMIAYAYGEKYIDMICTLIPSKKGLKLGFYKGNELPDPDGLLEGTGKISRYIVITDEKQIRSAAIQEMIQRAFENYKVRKSG